MTAIREPVADPFVHPALLYRGWAEYLAGTLPFIFGGLDAGEPVAVSVPGPQLRELRKALGEDAERVQMLDITEEGRNPGRIIPGVLMAFADRHPDVRVRIIGEPIWPARSAAEYPACVAHEALINLAFTGRAVTILCPYDIEGLAPHIVEDAMRTHPLLIDVSGPRSSERFAPDEVIASYNQPFEEHAGAAVRVVGMPDLHMLRQFVAGQAREAGMSPDGVDDVVLAVGELVANSIVHAHDDAKVAMWLDGTHLVCEVRDHGYLADPLAGRHPALPGQLGGRGLLLVNQLAALVRVYSVPSSTAVRAWFRINA